MRQPLVRTELVQVPVTAYAPLPAALTDPLPQPEGPARNCAQRDGTPAVCALDALLWIVQPQATIDRANEDRATAAKLSAGAGLTPGDGAEKP